jgi:hypothetical protein
MPGWCVITGGDGYAHHGGQYAEWHHPNGLDIISAAELTDLRAVYSAIKWIIPRGLFSSP